jgi:hypothetical protein
MTNLETIPAKDLDAFFRKDDASAKAAYEEVQKRLLTCQYTDWDDAANLLRYMADEGFDSNQDSITVAVLHPTKAMLATWFAHGFVQKYNTEQSLIRQIECSISAVPGRLFSVLQLRRINVGIEA